MTSQTKFVSNIPNNKLEPVFLGGSSQKTTSTKSNGVFVPSCVKSENESSIPKVPQVNEQSFPSLLGSTKVVKPFLGYANALKKPATEVTKPVIVAQNKIIKKPVKKYNYEEYSDSESDNDDYSESFMP